jgi:hypothetical protein
MGASDLRVTVELPKLRCVVDPALALGHVAGPRLAQCLTRVFETWLTRSFWQLLDASELLPDSGPSLPALNEWLLLRERTDAGSWALRWVGDNLAETLAGRQEAMPGSDWRRGFDPVAGAYDTLALSAALEGALILSPCAPGDAVPCPVQALQRLRLPVVRIDDASPGLFATERQLVRQSLASVGLAALLQSLPPLAVVHVLVAPRAPLDSASADEEPDPWTHAQAWWYPV